MKKQKSEERKANDTVQSDILVECESHVKRMIIVMGGSTLIDTILLLVTPIYLQQKLNASATSIGIILSLTTGIYLCGSTSIPYIAESKSLYLKNISYDNLSVIRLFCSIVVICFMANIPSIEAFAVFSVLNSLFNIGAETALGSASLLLPEERRAKYLKMVCIAWSLVFVVGSLILSLAIAFFTYQQLFYLCAFLYSLFFIFSVKYVWNKEGKLLSEQMLFFKKDFYVEKKRRLSMDLNLKYLSQDNLQLIVTNSLREKKKQKRDQKSVNKVTDHDIAPELRIGIQKAIDIALEHQTEDQQEIEVDAESRTVEEDFAGGKDTENLLQETDHNSTSELSLNSQERGGGIDFPIYDRSATEILQFDLESNPSGISRSKSELLLSRRDWIIIYLIAFAFLLMSMEWEFGTKWFVLYVMSRFKGHSVSMSSMIIGINGIGGMCGVIVFKTCTIITGRLLYGQIYDTNKRREIIIKCSVFALFHFLLALVSFIWMFVPEYYYGIFFMFMDGFVVHGISPFVTKMVIIHLGTEHLEAKILAIVYSSGWVAGALGNLLMGLLWDLSIEWLLYSMIGASMLICLPSFIIMIMMRE